MLWLSKSDFDPRWYRGSIALVLPLSSTRRARSARPNELEAPLAVTFENHCNPLKALYTFTTRDRSLRVTKRRNVSFIYQCSRSILPVLGGGGREGGEGGDRGNVRGFANVDFRRKLTIPEEENPAISASHPDWRCKRTRIGMMPDKSLERVNAVRDTRASECSNASR